MLRHVGRVFPCDVLARAPRAAGRRDGGRAAPSFPMYWRENLEATDLVHLFLSHTTVVVHAYYMYVYMSNFKSSNQTANKCDWSLDSNQTCQIPVEGEFEFDTQGRG